MTPGVLVLCGPTASGKTDSAIALARRFDGEIVSADSRQIYRGMPVGTAAPDAAQLAAVPHHLVGFLDPRERYSAAAFVRDALAAIAGIVARGRVAIVAGGTGFYIRALCGDIELRGERDDALRARLAREIRIHPADVMHEWLAAVAPERAAQIRPGDPYRVTRGLEIALAGRTGAQEPAAEPHSLRTELIPYRKVYLDVGIGELESRIAERVDRMLRDGLLDEAERLGSEAVAADAVGYPEALAYLRGFSTRREMRARLVRATRRFAKRQATWFRVEPDLVRIVPNQAELERLAGELPGWGAR